MIVFATYVTDASQYGAVALAGIQRASEPDSLVVEVDDQPSIAAAYNEVLGELAEADGLEAIALVRQGIEVLDEDFCDQVRSQLQDPDVAIVGVIGARDLGHVEWLRSEHRFGELTEPGGVLSFSAGVAEVHAVDGIMLVLSPWAARELRFDGERFPNDAGWDVDLCSQALAAGKRVMVAPIRVAQQVAVPLDVDAVEAADHAWKTKWESATGPGTAPAAAKNAGLTIAPLGGVGGAPAGPQASSGSTAPSAPSVMPPAPSVPAAPPSGERRAAGLRGGDNADDGYFEHTRPELRERVPQAARRVLDVGCGSGALGAALKAERPDIEVIGLEGFPEAAARAAERLNDALCVDLDGLQELPFPAGHFDAMVFGDVLEHLRQPEQLLTTLRRYLADDGVLVLSIPNVKHWSVIAPLLVNDRWTYEEAGLLDRTHVYFFTLDEAVRMLDRAGYAMPSSVGVNDHAPLPDSMLPLVEAGVALGGDRLQVQQRLGAYQYLVVVGPKA